MKLRIRVSVTMVIEAADEKAALAQALERAKGMDPEAHVLGVVLHETLDVNSVGQGQASRMR